MVYIDESCIIVNLEEWNQNSTGNPMHCVKFAILRDDFWDLKRILPRNAGHSTSKLK